MSTTDLLDAFLSGVDPLVSNNNNNHNNIDIHKRDSLLFSQPEPENFVVTLTKSTFILVIVALLSSVAVIFPTQVIPQPPQSTLAATRRPNQVREHTKRRCGI